MKHERMVKKLNAPKRPPKAFSKCGFVLDSTNKIENVIVPLSIFSEQFDNLNDRNYFFEIYEYVEEVNDNQE